VRWPAIQKPPASWKVPPNLLDYGDAVAAFSWDAVRAELQGLPGGRGLNIAHEAVDRHADGPQGERTAIRWLGADDDARAISYRELKRLTNRFANVLDALGVAKADTVAVLAGRISELYIAALGTLKHASVFCPLFSVFGPEPVFQRLGRGDAKILVTTEALFRRKVDALMDRLPALGHVLLVDADDHRSERLLSLPRLMAGASEDFLIPPTDPEDIAVLHFTSGTTGMPKGAMHVHGAVLTHYVTGKFVMDFHPDDVFWCTADPGWVTGTSYGIIAPLVHGITHIVDEADFDAMRWCRILESQGVTVWYTAPTAIRRTPDVQGDLALRPGWPSMFRGYLHDETRYQKSFVGGCYLTGDLARRDADGYFWFVGRADDIIKTSGHMVGPFEVESTLMEHPAVAEAGVIGKPDPLIGEMVKAFVSLKPGFAPDDALRLELIGFARRRLGSAVAPKEIDFKADLPKNKAGKIMRRLLKARELGLPEGDLSTLEESLGPERME
jgi:acetyl-CoA synthetase